MVLVVPISVVAGFQIGGVGNFLTIAVVFGIVPLLDALVGLDTSNPSNGADRVLSDDKHFRHSILICPFG